MLLQAFSLYRLKTVKARASEQAGTQSRKRKVGGDRPDLSQLRRTRQPTFHEQKRVCVGCGWGRARLLFLEAIRDVFYDHPMVLMEISKYQTKSNI